jgi:hypothetical protein
MDRRSFGPACTDQERGKSSAVASGGTGLGNLVLGKLEIVQRRLAARARTEENLPVLCGLRFH